MIHVSWLTSMTDPIADMLIRIKNAVMARKEAAQIPYSGIKMEIARILEREGYIASAERKGKKNRKILEVVLASPCDPNRKQINNVRRISKSSRRMYLKAKEIKKVKNGYGMAVVSTSKGLKTDQEARKENLGGEIMFEIW